MTGRSPFPLSLLLAFATSALAAVAPDRALTFDYSFVEDQMKMGVADHVEFQQLSDTPVVYRAWGVWNLAHPAPEVAAVALDFNRYPGIFRYVYRCSRITQPKNRVRGLSAWYVEGRAAIARVWSIGTIDTISRPDPSHLRFFASQNEDKALEAKWARQLPGWLNYRTHGVRLAAFIASAGRDSCRVGIVAQGWVWQPMPQWLVRLATGIILPQLLADLDNEVARRAQENKTAEPPWYKKWYQAIRRFL